ncbi:TIR domain-containing protein [Methylomonas sp. MS20]|uniref:TIR domain-containing protein n=1 Tax=unclassified Methylomonas TaxID=2608980 RepID=UPI0028A30049|nr:TIR domain-containing protein [Methylomonas sp. MV1]MDT4328651.1 TIR domain-containing protein [Methylomonas sp. MV1]
MINLEEVFKVGGVPTLTFVEPVEYSALLVALRTPGRGVVIEGPSGIGKTTAVNRALDKLDQTNSALVLSARKSKDVDIISNLPEIDNAGVVIVDDFHQLEVGIKHKIANYMKVLADEERKDSKIVLLGINQAGQALVNFAHDLNNRVEIIKFEANPEYKLIELLEKGEAALNIELNVKQEITESAHGSFYIAQMLAHQACLDSGILETPPTKVTTAVSFELVRGKVFDRLSRSFRDRTIRFAQGTRVRREGRAPYLHLLFWLGKSVEWSLSIDDALMRYPELRGSVIQIVDKGYLENLISDNEDIKTVLHFDSTTKLLSVEDPQYIYYLRNISWSSLAKESGFMTMNFPCPYDFALSFSGNDRNIAKSLFDCLSEMEFEVFYDQNEQHRMLAADVEDYLRPIYMTDAQFVIVLLGEEYPKRIWTRFESKQFRDRFRENSVIPIWFDSVPEGTFDESSRVGGVIFKSSEEMEPQIQAIADLFRRKIGEIRGS